MGVWCAQGFFYIRSGDLVPQDVIDRHFEVNKRWAEDSWLA